MFSITRIPCEILLDIHKFLPRHEIEKSQLVSIRWKNVILNNLSVFPLHLLQSLKIVPKYKYNDPQCGGVIIYSEMLEKQILIPVIAGKFEEEILVAKSLKYCVFEKFEDKETSLAGYEVMEIVEQLSKICGEKLKVIELLAFGSLKDTVFILAAHLKSYLGKFLHPFLENYVSASRAFIDTPIEQVLAILTDPSLWRPPANIELSFSVSVFSTQFIEFIQHLDFTGSYQYQLIARLNRNMDKHEFFDSIIEVYETCLDPTKKIRKIRFCNLAQIDLSDDFIKRRRLVSHTNHSDRFFTVDTYVIELAHRDLLQIAFIQKELDRGWVEYECTFDILDTNI